ncbi:similar to Saccharomyces cerevisiae YDR175C RSM24 Mitochondrial ribosomal protein of the small subunit [Maudiozyma saulgeensis]|uniref:Small ribosomal subunit protein mS35 n=1 Tax=Maudiozyma saulgeensis TaxID=1789683 RepID=A0A1X7R6G9_9SACH|nr:similar to Saccharomyces cerevisiae YDR175C RSM24 Mitochondrial ribosomal protein of the small subunit [Kazachstania saulgeensis]
MLSLRCVNNVVLRTTMASNLTKSTIRFATTDATSKKDVKATEVKENLQTSPVESTQSTELYMNPGKWTGLEPTKIISLFWERKTKLGTDYKRCPEELDALLSTADFSGMTKNEIKKIYEDTTNAMGTGMVSKKFLRDGLRPFQFDELPSPAQDVVDEHREQRYYNRLAIYDLPLLTQYRQKYTNPSIKTHPITYRYTSYIGEEHPNGAKVVLSVKTKDLPLNEKQLHKLRLLARTRYDHETDIFKMSSDKFPESAQNARYLHDIFQRLMKESKDLADDFSDVPLDTRHIAAKNLRKRKNDYVFPEEWKRPDDAPVETINVLHDILKTSQAKE